MKERNTSEGSNPLPFNLQSIAHPLGLPLQPCDVTFREGGEEVPRSLSAFR